MAAALIAGRKLGCGLACVGPPYVGPTYELQRSQMRTELAVARVDSPDYCLAHLYAPAHAAALRYRALRVLLPARCCRTLRRRRAARPGCPAAGGAGFGFPGKVSTAGV